MSVRKSIARTTTNSVHKNINGIMFHLYRENGSILSKSILYSKLKSIEKGTLKVDLPLKCMWSKSIALQVNNDKTVTFMFCL